MRRRIPSLLCALGLLAPFLAHAGEPASDEPDGPEARAEVDLQLGTDTRADTEAQAKGASRWDPREDQKWIRRWRPEPRMVELGVYGGVFLLNRKHELFRPNHELPLQGWQPLRQLNPNVGARVGYYPLSFIGFEAEGGAMPSKLDDGAGALPFTVRGHVVAQLGRWSVTPFVLIGGGMIGVNNAGPLGTDIDPALHFGGGVKVYINRWLLLRLDLRDVVTHMQGVDNTFESHNFEAVLGLSVSLNRRNTPRRPAPVAVAAGPGDRDGDGIPDDVDACPDEPETFNGFQDDDGCPEYDRDGDGFWDEQDACPDEPGVAPDGCPVPDTDGDGIFDDVDQCIHDPETFNGFEDEDGCPDELPEAIKRFTGSIKGITFDTNQATIRRTSLPILDETVLLLEQYPNLRIEIAGHTDNHGAHDHNLELSRQRAAAVKSYLVGMGISDARIETTGFGPDVPIDSNATKAGRANNRRIEFNILGASRS